MDTESSPLQHDQYGVSLASLSTTTLVGQPSCIAFSPNHHDLFVIGTYQLDQSSELYSDSNQAANGDGRQNQSRSGTVQLFRLENNRKITKIEIHNLTSTPIQHARDARPSGAVLDLRFSTSLQYRNTFAVCTSTGLIILFQLTVPEKLSSNSPLLELVHVFTIFTAETLLTSLAWNPDPPCSEEADLAVTFSDGRFAALMLPMSKYSESDAQIQHIQTLHSESVWTAQWCTSTQTGLRRIATGGDDATIHVITIPQTTDPTNHPTIRPEADAEAEAEPQQALHAIDLLSLHKPSPSESHQYDDRTHTAGVAAILPLNLPNKTQVLMTGSYDNHIRILRPRINSRRWESLAEMDLGGGVWKLDLLSSICSTIGGDETDTRWLVLASCMHAGVRIVEIRCVTSVAANAAEEKWGMNVLALFTEHTSMCYASAAVATTSDATNRQIWQVVSTSFYDRMVCVWEFEWTTIHSS